MVGIAKSRARDLGVVALSHDTFKANTDTGHLSFNRKYWNQGWKGKLGENLGRAKELFLSGGQ